MSKDKKANYYDVGGIEVFEVIKAKLTREQFIGFLLGNSMKYQLRCNWKQSFERDVEKSKNYTTWLNEYLECNVGFVQDEDIVTDAIENDVLIDLS